VIRGTPGHIHGAAGAWTIAAGNAAPGAGKEPEKAPEPVYLAPYFIGRFQNRADIRIAPVGGGLFRAPPGFRQNRPEGDLYPGGGFRRKDGTARHFRRPVPPNLFPGRRPQGGRDHLPGETVHFGFNGEFAHPGMDKGVKSVRRKFIKQGPAALRAAAARNAAAPRFFPARRRLSFRGREKLRLHGPIVLTFRHKYTIQQYRYFDKNPTHKKIPRRRLRGPRGIVHRNR
jgi:hypothetical protein